MQTVNIELSLLFLHSIWLIPFTRPNTDHPYMKLQLFMGTFWPELRFSDVILSSFSTLKSLLSDQQTIAKVSHLRYT